MNLTQEELTPIVSYAFWYLARGKTPLQVRERIKADRRFPQLTPAELNDVLSQALEHLNATRLVNASAQEWQGHQ